MQTAFGETTYPVMGMIKWHKTYFGMVGHAAERRRRDRSRHLGFVLFRVGAQRARCSCW